MYPSPRIPVRPSAPTSSRQSGRAAPTMTPWSVAARRRPIFTSPGRRLASALALAEDLAEARGAAACRAEEAAIDHVTCRLPVCGGGRLKTHYDSIAKALETIATGLLSAALESVTRPKLMVRPRRTTRASASTSDDITARMKCVV